MATFTSVINTVLRRMRESEVAGPTSSDYATLIGDFVNETKREVEDAWKWHSLRTTVPVTTSDGVSQYSVTGAGERYKLQDKRFSVYNTTDQHRLTMQNAQWLKQQAINNPTTQAPSYFYFEGMDGSGDPYVNFYSTPDGVYVINFELVVPQDDFSTGTEEFSTPWRPIMLGAYSKAIAERGEDNGRSHGESEGRYQAALSDAIAIDEARSPYEDGVWYA